MLRADVVLSPQFNTNRHRDAMLDGAPTADGSGGRQVEKLRVIPETGAPRGANDVVLDDENNCALHDCQK
jgi:hypothetical protein